MPSSTLSPLVALVGAQVVTVIVVVAVMGAELKGNRKMRAISLLSLSSLVVVLMVVVVRGVVLVEWWGWG